MYFFGLANSYQGNFLKKDDVRQASTDVQFLRLKNPAEFLEKHWQLEIIKLSFPEVGKDQTYFF